MEQTGVNIHHGFFTLTMEQTGVNIHHGFFTLTMEHTGVNIHHGFFTLTMEHTGVNIHHGFFTLTMEQTGVNIHHGFFTLTMKQTGVNIHHGFFTLTMGTSRCEDSGGEPKATDRVSGDGGGAEQFPQSDDAVVGVDVELVLVVAVGDGVSQHILQENNNNMKNLSCCQAEHSVTRNWGKTSHIILFSVFRYKH